MKVGYFGVCKPQGTLGANLGVVCSRKSAMKFPSVQRFARNAWQFWSTRKGPDGSMRRVLRWVAEFLTKLLIGRCLTSKRPSAVTWTGGTNNKESPESEIRVEGRL
jgi:hypothetical protein